LRSNVTVLWTTTACLSIAWASSASVYYDYDLAAMTGTSSLVLIENEISINDDGQVAFIGDQNASAGFESVYVSPLGALATSINPTFSASGRTFGPGVEINASGQVAARDAISGDSFIRLWNAATGAFTIIDRSDTGPFDSVGFRPGTSDPGQVTHGAFTGANNFLVLAGGSSVAVGNLFSTWPAIANDGGVVARVGPAGDQTDPIVHFTSAGAATTVASTAGGWTELGRAPGISRDGSLVAWIGNRGMGRGVFVAPVSAPSNVTVVAGENGNTPVPCPAPGCTTNPDLGYDAAGLDIFLTFTDADRDGRVGIALQEPAGAGAVAGNSFVVTFAGQPSSASVENPVLGGGTPLVFSDQAGLWSVQADIENELDPAGPLVFNANNALPIVQVGDSLPTSMGSFTIDSFLVYDPVANVALDAAGMPRTQRRGDHQVAFRAVSGSNAVVIRARHLDSDEDGLFDHWEAAGGGIDVDQDGSADLDLNSLGADPTVRDLFIEIDWIRPRNDPPRSYSNQPADAATAMVAAVFSAAPALPSGVPAGVVAHIDAGTGTDTLGNPFSQNFPPAFAQGGDLIGQTGAPTAHLDLVYAGTDGSFLIPGGQVRSFENIKRTFFGTADKFAREFAFHYLVLADSFAAYEDFATDADGDGALSALDMLGGDGVLTTDELRTFDSGPVPRGTAPSQPTVVSATAATATVSGFIFPTVGSGLAGAGVLVTSGVGAGQLRQVASTSGAALTLAQPWATTPSAGDTLTFLFSSSGLAEVDFRPSPNNHGAPGNDFLMTLGIWGVHSTGTLAEPFVQWRTIVHELGHNLGLRHCGTNPDASVCIALPATYESLMSYAHQTKKGTGINSYSPSMPPTPDPTFDDWFNLRPDFSRATVHIGNTSGLGLGVAGPLAPGSVIGSENLEEHEITLDDHLQANGPLDLEAPLIDIVSPPPFSSVLQSSDLTVTVAATDNIALSPVSLTFDVYGSGAIDAAGETLVAAPIGSDEFEATFMSVAGPDGPRDIVATVSDTADQMAMDTQPILVPEPSVTLSLAAGALFLAFLGRRRGKGV
jgi:hypothetical protein